MASIQLAEDLITDEELVTNLGSVLQGQARSGRPLIITQGGKAAGVLMTPAMFDSITEQRQVLGLVLQGLHDAIRGELVDDEEVWSGIGELLAKTTD